MWVEAGKSVDNATNDMPHTQLSIIKLIKVNFRKFNTLTVTMDFPGHNDWYVDSAG
jgi:hypothetical protein